MKGISFLLCGFLKYQLTIYMWVYLRILYSIPLIYLSLLMAILHCIDYWNFKVSIEIRWLSRFFSLLCPIKKKMCVLGPLHFYIHFKINSSMSTKACSRFDWDSVELVEQFENYCILIILRFPVQECGISIYLVFFNFSYVLWSLISYTYVYSLV